MNTDPTGYYSLSDISAAIEIEACMAFAVGISVYLIYQKAVGICMVSDISNVPYMVIVGDKSVVDELEIIAEGSENQDEANDGNKNTSGEGKSSGGEYAMRILRRKRQ